MLRDQAIYNTHPLVKTILDGVTALDALGNVVVINEGVVVIELERLMLTTTRAKKLKYVNAEADKHFNLILAPYPQHEINTWPNQYAEAWALKSDPLAYTPTLNSLALNYGKTVALLAQDVLAKAASYTVISGEIIGKRKKLTDQVMAATKVAEMEAITWI